MDMLREDRLALQRGPQQGPYPGMRPFEAEFREYFFGREVQIREVVQRLSGGHHFAAILGGSGCGKSSLIRAGVIPELRTGGIKGASSSWLPVIYTPEESPVGNLAAAFRRVLDVQAADCPSLEELTRVLMQRDGLAELLPIVKRHGRIRRAASEPAAANLLVVVDQFEEIFRQGNRASGEAESLVTLLLDNFRNPDPQVYVILTLRSEDLHSCATYVGLPEALNCATYLVPRLHDHEIEEVIRSPAEYFAWKAGASLDFDQGVCVRLIEETQKLKEDPDHLPLLQHLLFRLWCAALAREGGGEGAVPARILPEDLDQAVRPGPAGESGEGGGLLAACLDNHAEAIYHALAPAARQVAKRMLPMLAVVDPSGVVKRNFLARDDLRAACPDHEPATIDAAVAAFTAPHPYLRDAGLLDVAHESFIRKWKRFYGAVSEEYQRARLFRGLVYLHQEWCQARDADGGRGLPHYVRSYARLPDRQSIARYDRYRVTRPTLEQVRRWVGQARVQPLPGETWESTLASLQAFLSKGRMKAMCRRGLAMALALLVIGGTPVMVWQGLEKERLAREGKALKAYMAASDSGQRANPEDPPEIRQAGMTDVVGALEVLKASVGDGGSPDPALRKVQWRAEVQISDALRRYTGMIWPTADPAPAAPPPAERERRVPRCDSVLPGEGGRIVAAGDGRAVYLPGDDTVHSAVLSGDGTCVESSRHLLFLPGAKIEVDRDLAMLVANVPPEIDPGSDARPRRGSKLFFYALAWERTAPGGGWAALTPAPVGVLPANPALSTAGQWWVALDRAEAKGPLRVGLFTEENAPAAVSYRYLPPNWLPWVDPGSPALREVWQDETSWTPVDLSGPASPGGSAGCGFAGAFGKDYCLRLEQPPAGESPGQPSAQYLRFLPSLPASEAIPLASVAVIGAGVEAIDLGRGDLAGWLRVKADGRWHFGPWSATALADVAGKMRGSTSPRGNTSRP